MYIAWNAGFGGVQLRDDPGNLQGAFCNPVGHFETRQHFGDRRHIGQGDSALRTAYRQGGSTLASASNLMSRVNNSLRATGSRGRR